MAATWTIVSMDRDIKQAEKDNVVTKFHYRVEDKDNDNNSAFSLGSVSVTLGSSSFVTYENITHDVALQWAKDALGSDEVTAIETNIASEIAELKTPTKACGVSW